MEESVDGDNDQQGEEKVINIIVIQEPPEWPKTGGTVSGPGNKISLKDVRDDGALGQLRSDRFKTGSRNPTSHHNPVYKSQSFIIESNSEAASVLKVPPPPMEYTVKMRNGTEEEGEASGQKRVKLGCHKSLSFPMSSSTFSSSSYAHGQNQTLTSVTNITSSTKVTPQAFLPSSCLPFSPVISSSSSSSSSQYSLVATDPETPTAATTPDSGFYTPSQFEPSSSCTSANPFFTSTPRRSVSAGPQTSTPCLLDTPKRVKNDVLQQRFRDLCSAMDWDSLDDSGAMSEDPKEGNDSGEGESSPNSSLRSVQWLKGFSIGDSVKPLLSSPPTPCDKNQNLSSSASEIIQTTTCTNSSSMAASISSLAAKTSAFSSSPSLKPLPVIMAPRIPTYLQSQCTITPSSSSSSSSCLSMQGASVLTTQGQEANGNGCSNSKKAGQRKALEELKMNKSERNIGRSKYTGKIFSRPGYSYMDLIKMAMQSSEEGEMTLKQIVTWIEDHFPFFKHEAKDSWKSSIRHNLSLHSDFMKADEKKHGCKWKLCNDVVQPNLHVPAPQEMTSVQTAFLKRAKKNVPQPILPKVNAYALVPIHNLTNPVSDTAQHQPPQSLPPPPPPAPSLLRKPIHILPKQADETAVQPVLIKEEGHDVEFNNHQQFYQIVSQETPSDQHQVIQQLLQSGPQHNTVIPTVYDDSVMFSTSDYISNAPSGIYQSSDSNSSHSVGFPSLSSFDQSLPSTSQLADPNIDCAIDIGDATQTRGSFCYAVKHQNSLISTEPPIQTSSSHEQHHQQNFPLNSVVEIRQEEGAKPGEKKIVFVLQDSENSKRLKNQKKSEVSKERSSGSCGSSGRKLSKNLSEIFDQQESTTTAAKSSGAVKSFSFGGKKKTKDCQKSNRQHRGPVLNLQSVLQSSLEDKSASDTIGLLLQEEDEGQRLMCKEGGVGQTGFTRVKSFSERESLHLNSHMQRALQEQTANIMSFAGSDTNASGTLLEEENSNSHCSLDRPQSNRLLLPKAGSRLLPFSTLKKNGLSLRDRMGLVKNKNVATSKCSDEVTTSFANDVGQKTFSCQDGGLDSSSLCSTTRSASQLVFRRLSSGDHSSVSLGSTASSHSLSSSSASSFCDSASKAPGDCERDREISMPNSRRVGNILRSKSRRKQVHVPLTIEISPVRKKYHAISEEDKEPSVIFLHEENAQFMEISGERDCQTKHHSSSTAEQHPMSLCTDVQQPSLKILQEKPLEQYEHLTSLKEKPIKLEQNTVSEDISFSGFQMNSTDIDKVMENIFICSGSPVKDKTTDKNVQLSFGCVTNSNNSSIAVDHPFPSEYDTPPSMLHFLSTFPKDMEFLSQPSGNENNRALDCDDNNRLIPRGHLDTRISSASSDQHHHRSPVSSSSNHFLHTPSPPPKYRQGKTSLSSASSAQKKINCKDEGKSFDTFNLSPAPFISEISVSANSLNGNNSSSWSTSNSSMYTPPCGTMFRSSSSSKLSSRKPSVTGESMPVKSSCDRDSDNCSKTMLTPHHDDSDIVQPEILKRQGQHNLLPLQSISNNEKDVDEHSLIPSVHHRITPSSSTLSSTAAASSYSSLPLSSPPVDLTSFVASYSLTTPPCGNGNNATFSSNSTCASSNTPLFLTVPGAAVPPFILSPSSTANNINQQQQHTEIFPSFTPESLSSVLDPSIMENLDMFINSLPGLSPGFNNIHLSPH